MTGVQTCALPISVQEKAGQVVGSTTQQAKGLAKEAEGKAQKGLGDVKDAVRKP